MTVKMTVAEWNRFQSDKSAWPDSAYYVDSEMRIDGRLLEWDDDIVGISDFAILSVTGGMFYLSEYDTDGTPIEVHFRRWRKKQNITFILCEAPKDRAAEVEAAIVTAGGRVQKL